MKEVNSSARGWNTVAQKIAGCFCTLVSLLLIAVWVHQMWQSHIEDTGIEFIAKGNTMVQAGDPTSLEKAVETYKKAADVFHGIGSKESRNEGLAYYNMARAYHALKQDDEALESGLKSVPLLTNANAREDLAGALGNIGLYCVSTKQLDKGFENYSRAAAIYKELNKPDMAQKMVNVEAAIRFDQTVEAAKAKDWPKARALCIQSQDLYHQAGNKTGEADATHELSLIYTVMGDAPKSADASSREQALRGVTGAKP
jgi:tetratricopeptide (TPR) repeat protein